MTASTAPASTCAPTTTSTDPTTPAAGATTGCCIFIASSTSNGCPALDRVAGGHVHRDDRPRHRRHERSRGDDRGRVREAGEHPERHRPAVTLDVDVRALGAESAEAVLDPGDLQHDLVRRRGHQHDVVPALDPQAAPGVLVAHLDDVVADGERDPLRL